MKLMKIAAKSAVAAAIGAGVLGAGAGVAQADPHWPWPQPPGPGVNVGGPGNPLPPGQDGLPPPGHRWTPVSIGVPPIWAPPAPPPPPWAPFAPVVWNADAQIWGIQVGTSFVAL
ncbi:hypothetical protein FHT40_001743 [Mycolicibacterium sp. BK556]|uniref:hypothetical protein n=1 Tax=Mycobacteriaceae TaxID=1762 RepID=UPI0010608E58|nr:MULTISPECIES: hypothetical protein [Mycobacteriaceae]MBB3602110.1 hypothetical protein [Mycolicibacterium sp. BK556]MBB3631862.1 hypothetical protein [Mycolicibacterium sp. BK607]MBB3749881.1 hypothetical protein [Mycolicibacterium sp. BK634]TDO18846.1 hypothetical protein EV580_2035 [Mycobacterium sp. BK086]